MLTELAIMEGSPAARSIVDQVFGRQLQGYQLQGYDGVTAENLATADTIIFEYQDYAQAYNGEAAAWGLMGDPQTELAKLREKTAKTIGKLQADLQKQTKADKRAKIEKKIKDTLASALKSEQKILDKAQKAAQSAQAKADKAAVKEAKKAADAAAKEAKKLAAQQGTAVKAAAANYAAMPRAVMPASITVSPVGDPLKPPPEISAQATILLRLFPDITAQKVANLATPVLKIPKSTQKRMDDATKAARAALSKIGTATKGAGLPPMWPNWIKERSNEFIPKAVARGIMDPATLQLVPSAIPAINAAAASAKVPKVAPFDLYSAGAPAPIPFPAPFPGPPAPPSGQELPFEDGYDAGDEPPTYKLPPWGQVDFGQPIDSAPSVNYPMTAGGDIPAGAFDWNWGGAPAPTPGYAPIDYSGGAPGGGFPDGALDYSAWGWGAPAPSPPVLFDGGYADYSGGFDSSAFDYSAYGGWGADDAGTIDYSAWGWGDGYQLYGIGDLFKNIGKQATNVIKTVGKAIPAAAATAAGVFLGPVAGAAAGGLLNLVLPNGQRVQLPAQNVAQTQTGQIMVVPAPGTPTAPAAQAPARDSLTLDTRTLLVGGGLLLAVALISQQGRAK